IGVLPERYLARGIGNFEPHAVLHLAVGRNGDSFDGKLQPQRVSWQDPQVGPRRPKQALSRADVRQCQVASLAQCQDGGEGQTNSDAHHDDNPKRWVWNDTLPAQGNPPRAARSRWLDLAQARWPWGR